jgi:SEC-C motif-containing protein
MNLEDTCPCGSNAFYSICCQPIIKGERNAISALELMKSRYSAYVHCEANYIIESTAKSQRKMHSRKDILIWAKESIWVKLEIVHFTKDTVEFKAHYQDKNKLVVIHHEFSTFIKENEIWYFFEGESIA